MMRPTRRIRPTRKMRPSGKHGELDTPQALRAHLALTHDLSGLVLQGLDLAADPLPDDALLHGTVFLGCTFSSQDQARALSERGAAIMPRFQGLPYRPARSQLYSVGELLDGFQQGGYTTTRDFRVYTHYDRDRRHPRGPNAREALAQRLHDHSIDDALEEFLAEHSHQEVVGIMGGHGTSRLDPYYRQVVLLAWELTRNGYLIASGGGPGIMEAANLGGWLACFSDPRVIDEALELLAPAPVFSGGEAEGTPAYLEAIERYFLCAQRVVDELERSSDYERVQDAPGVSLAVPTWFYGHEPTNLFGTHVAKYFSNSLREDGLLAIATGGVVYAPGSAGTMQEIFQDLAQNHYATFTLRSPMVFLGRARYQGLKQLLDAFVSERGQQQVYGDLLALCDEASEAAAFIRAHPPRPEKQSTPLYELLP